MADERRLTTRMNAKWIALSRDETLPRQADLNPAIFGLDQQHCAIVQLAPVPGDAKLLYVGESLRNDDWSVDDDQRVADYPPNSLIGLAAAKIPAVLTKRSPLTFGGTGVNGVEAILYRAILLPLSNDGAVISHVIAAINCRLITAVQEYSDAGESPKPLDKAAAAIAFSSRRMVFAPAVATRVIR